MILALRVAEGLAGVFIVGTVLNDVFNGVVVPRPTSRRLSPAALLLRSTWVAWRGIGTRMANSARRERFLGVFAPLALIMLLLLWILGEVLGFGLIVRSLGSQLSREPTLADSLYAAGSSLETLGTGDVVATGPVARAVFVLAAVIGLGTAAMVITLLFSLYAHFQAREATVVTLDARAGAPPSGVTLLETYGRLDMTDQLTELFTEWERWSARVLDTHLAYPILAYFRSSHDNESWLSALGAVLDAAVLTVTTVEGVPRGPALMMAEIGIHLVEDLGHARHLDQSDRVGVERQEYDDARARLSSAGYRLSPPEPAWEKFSNVRGRYAYRLNDLARHWATPPSQWIGDRTILSRHH